MAGYEYIIVGGGSAGCVLADRLSERSENRVLLLEAGPPDTAPAIKVPALMASLFGGPNDWNFQTEPQVNAGDRRVAWPLGRTLGGSSSTNATIYIEGSPADFDSWRDDFGCAGWGASDLAPYFAKSRERLHVAPLRYKDKLTMAWVASAERLGLTARGDFAGPTVEGAGFFQVNQRHGRRRSTADAYLRPALSRPNLTVHTGALATKIVIEGGRAVGVSYRVDGVDLTERATTEVILSAGAVNSPHLLLLSGVGPADQLARFGVELEADRPSVGAGLQDHPRVTAVWTMSGPPRRAPLARLRWRLWGRGPFASNGGEAGGFVRSREGVTVPDVQFMACPPSVMNRGATPTVAVLVTCIDVHSRGSVRLQSADPAERPAIDPGYLTDGRDLDALVAGVEQARQIAAMAPFADRVTTETMPGATIRREQLRSWVTQNVVTMHHPTSTCAMGGSAESVCDPELRVRGVANLRVVDASVMPAVPRGNTHAATVAIAERAADLILRRNDRSRVHTFEETH